MRLAHVAASSRSDPHIGPAIVPAARIEDAISADGHRNRHLAVAVGMPQELTGFRVIRVDPGIGIDDQLVSAARCNQKRGAVGTKPFSPIRFPDLFPGSPVEREQIGRRIVIAEQDQGILIHDWRAAMAQSSLNGEYSLPRLRFQAKRPSRVKAISCPVPNHA